MSGIEKVAAIVLAAGGSRRMSGANKLLETIDGKPILKWTIRAILEAGIRTVIVVTGHDREAVEQVAGDGPLCVHNPEWERGLASSLRRGIEALGPDAPAVLVALGDMPRIRPETVRALVGRFAADPGVAACVPVHEGALGNPVLWGRTYFESLRQCEGDRGARSLIERAGPEVARVVVDDPGILHDVDTPEDLARTRLASHLGASLSPVDPPTPPSS